MKNKQTDGKIRDAYSACSPFHSLDSVNNISSTNTDLNSSNGDQNNNQNGNSPMIMPMPSPALPNPTPTPSGDTGGSTTPPSAGCVNMPSGATVVLNTPFNTTDGEGQLWEVYPGSGKITQPSGASGSASTSILPAGQPVGGQQTIWPKPGKEQALNNIYMCMRFKMGAGYVGQQTANKLFFLAAQDFTFGKTGMNGFFGLQGSTSYPAPTFSLYFGHNSGNLDNSHACIADLGLGCIPNVNKTEMKPDTWYTIEAYMIASTCITCRNATVKWWVDGLLQGNYTNLNYGDGIVNEWQLNHTWDGGGAVQCGPPTNPSNVKGRDCRKDQIYYFDHVVLAAKGGRAPASK